MIPLNRGTDTSANLLGSYYAPRTVSMLYLVMAYELRLGVFRASQLVDEL